MSNVEKISGETGVIVLGMHRSGTSCIAGMLEAAGFTTGVVDQWTPDNQKGSRENLSVVRLNESLLKSAGGDWLNPPERLYNLSGIQLQTREQILRELGAGTRPWMFKDPRTLLTLPFWLESIRSPNLVGVFRHPLSVVDSLHTRNQIATVEGLQLWSHYNQLLLEVSEDRGIPLFLFSSDLTGLARAFAGYLMEHFQNLVDQGLINPARCGDFLSKGLLHHEQKPVPDLLPGLLERGVDESLAASVLNLWESLLLKVVNPMAQGNHVPGGGSVDENPDDGASSGIYQIERAASPEQKIQLARNLLNDNPARSDVWALGLKIIDGLGQVNRIAEWVDQGLEAVPDDPVLLKRKAELLWSRGEVGQAIETIEKVIKKTRCWIPAQRLYLRWLLENAEWRKTFLAFQSLVKELRPEPRSQYAQLFYDTGKGYNELESIKLPILDIDVPQFFTFELNCKGPIKSLRLDPVNSYSVLKVWGIRISGHDDVESEIEISSSNAMAVQEAIHFFSTKDCRIRLALPDHEKVESFKLTVCLDYLNIGETALERCIDKIRHDKQAVSGQSPGGVKMAKELAEVPNGFTENQAQVIRAEIENLRGAIYQYNEKTEARIQSVDSRVRTHLNQESEMTKELVGEFREYVRAQNDSIRMMLDYLSSKEKALNRKLKKKTTELKAAKKEMARLRERLTRHDELKLRLKSNEASLETRFQEIATLTKAIEARDGEVLALKQIIADMQTGENKKWDVILPKTQSTIAKYAGYSREERAASQNNARGILRNHMAIRHIRKSGLFDKAYYMNQYPELNEDKLARNNPIKHYVLYGAKQGRNPNKDFSTEWYLEYYQDVAKSGINPFQHYILFGREEGRIGKLRE